MSDNNNKPKKRVKILHDTGMVAHLWAHQSQEHAHDRNSRLYFDGDTIYSYGSHFPIARHIERKGKKAVLFTTREYSVTTRDHKYCVEGACCHLTVFHVYNVCGNEDRRQQFSEYRERYAELVKLYAKARSRRPLILADMRKVVEEANAFSAFFRLRVRLNLPENLEATVAECKGSEAREQERRKRLAAKRERELAERREKWLAGEPVAYPNGYGDPTRLRVVDDELQTSRGATVPLEHAIKAFRIIKRLRAKGESYRRNGHTIHLGHFALDEVDAQGNVRAGCHEVAWEEINRVAALVGVA